MNVFLVVGFSHSLNLFFLLFDFDITSLNTEPFQRRRNKFTYVSSLTRVLRGKIGKEDTGRYLDSLDLS